jgi:signal transduction histidine kinase/ligand-binding sensor domain-containing protein
MALIGGVLAASLHANPLAPAVAPVFFTHITVEDGLPHSYIRAIIKDRAGFMWFATARGLVRYDSAHLVVYHHDPNDPASLPFGEPACLLEDRQRRLWVGTVWGQWAGVGVLDKSTGRFTRYLADGRAGSLSASDVQAIYQDREDRLWVGHSQGIDLFDPVSKTFTAFPIDPVGSEPRVTAMLEDSRGTFWVATERRGLFLFDRDTHAFRSIAVRDRTVLGKRNVDDSFYAAFLEQPTGTLWVAGYGAGLVRIGLDSGRMKRYLPDPRRNDSLSVAHVVRLAGDGDRLIYVGTENGGLDVLDILSERFTHYRPDPNDPRSLGSPSIWALYRDEQGLVWAGANGFGVSCLSPLAQRFEAVRAGLGSSHVTSIAEGEHGAIWIGTDGGGLHVFDPLTGRVRRYPMPRGQTTSSSNAVQSVLAGPEGLIWVGFWNTGLCRIDTRNGRVRFYRTRAVRRSPMSDSIWRVVDAGGGELLVATNDGAFFFDVRRERYAPLSERYPGAGLGSIGAAAVDASRGLWLAHPTSLEHVDRRSGAVRRFEGDPESGGAFLGSFVLALHVDARGHVWVATERGLTCLDSGGHKLATYGEGDGLPDANVASITEDASGNIWVGTKGGLARLRGAVAAPVGAAVVAFDERDGMAGRICIRGAAFRSRGGELYFGTSRGLTHFLPEAFQENTYVPAVVLTELRLANRTVVPGSPGSPLSRPIEKTSELVISHAQADVTFSFAALNYIQPQKNRYTYRLEGLDRKWSPVGPEMSASYVRIPPGNYVFRVRACNNDGVWNQDGVRLRLRVMPPFWRTTWFGAAVAVALVVLGFSLHSSRLRRVRQRFAAVLGERRRLSRELHDTLEQGLAGIALQVDSARQHLGRRPEVVERCLETALHMVEYSREETRRTVNQLRSQALERGDIARAVHEVATELTSGGAPKVDVEVHGAPRRLSVAAEHHLFRIAQEALTNAVRHAHAARVCVSLTFMGDIVELTVSDDGRGIRPKQPDQGFHFGLSGMRERARALGTRLEIESAPGRGTTIRVRWSGKSDQAAGVSDVDVKA